MDEGGKYKFKKIIRVVGGRFEVKQKGYLNLKNILKLLANLIQCKKKLKEYLEVNQLRNHLKRIFREFHQL